MVLKIWVSTGIGDFDIYGCVMKIKFNFRIKNQ